MRNIQSFDEFVVESKRAGLVIKKGDKFLGYGEKWVSRADAMVWKPDATAEAERQAKKVDGEIVAVDDLDERLNENQGLAQRLSKSRGSRDYEEKEGRVWTWKTILSDYKFEMKRRNLKLDESANFVNESAISLKGGWSFSYRYLVTKGSDPTRMTFLSFRRGNSRIEAEEFQDSWKVDIQNLGMATGKHMFENEKKFAAYVDGLGIDMDDVWNAIEREESKWEPDPMGGIEESNNHSKIKPLRNLPSYELFESGSKYPIDSALKLYGDELEKAKKMKSDGLKAASASYLDKTFDGFFGYPSRDWPIDDYIKWWQDGLTKIKSMKAKGEKFADEWELA